MLNLLLILFYFDDIESLLLPKETIEIVSTLNLYHAKSVINTESQTM